MTKAELEKKKDLARSLFLSGMEQTEIADKVGVEVFMAFSRWLEFRRKPEKIQRIEAVSPLWERGYVF